MLARGAQSPIIGEVEVGVTVQLHLKRRHKNVTHPITKAQKVNTELFPKEFVLELNTKNLWKLYQLSNHYSYDSVR
jgi:hypothetical protein